MYGVRTWRVVLFMTVAIKSVNSCVLVLLNHWLLRNLTVLGHSYTLDASSEKPFKVYYFYLFIFTQLNELNSIQ